MYTQYVLTKTTVKFSIPAVLKFQRVFSTYRQISSKEIAQFTYILSNEKTRKTSSFDRSVFGNINFLFFGI